jgi:hypothetical protein
MRDSTAHGKAAIRANVRKWRARISVDCSSELRGAVLIAVLVVDVVI